MPRQVVHLHIGSPKTGTTFIQQVLLANRESLRRQGVLFPGATHKDQVLAAFDLLGLRFNEHSEPRATGAWDRLAVEAARFDGTTVVSQEFLGVATPKQARRAVESLSPAEVHVVYTARDLLRQLPSMWQTRARNGHVETWENFLIGVSQSDAAKTGPYTRLWQNQDSADICRRWAEALPTERIHVVTVPPSGSSPTVLWQRFATLVGIDPSSCDLDIGQHNTSLGLAEAEVLRRVNVELDQRMKWPDYRALVKDFLSRSVLSGRAHPVKLAVPAEHHAWIEERAERMIAGLRAGGYDVVGDLDELKPLTARANGAAARSPEDLAPEQMLDPAVEAVTELLLHMGDTQRQLAKVRRQLRTVRRHRGTAGSGFAAEGTVTKQAAKKQAAKKQAAKKQAAKKQAAKKQAAKKQDAKKAMKQATKRAAKKSTKKQAAKRAAAHGPAALTATAGARPDGGS